MIPFPPCLVFGAGHIRRGSGATWTGAEQLIKRRKGSTLDIKPYPLPWAAFHWHLCVWALSFCLSTFQWEPWEVPEVLSVPVLPAGGGLFPVLFRMWLAFEEKRKWNWWECLPLFFQDAGVSSHHIWLILSPCYVSSGKTQQAFSYPSLTRLCVPEAPLPIYQWVS